MTEKTDTEQTNREKEWELLGMAIEDLETMVKKKAEHRGVPVSDVLIDMLEFAQSQLEEKYTNVHHIFNRVVYVLQSGMVVDNPNLRDGDKEEIK
jgi:hypothetical protein